MSKKSNPYTLALTRKNARKGRMPIEQANIDPYELARDRTLRPGATDWRTERQASCFAAVVTNVVATDRRITAERDRWGEVVAQSDPSTPKSLMVQSQAIRKPSGRDFDGAKDGGASEPTANDMRQGIEVNWDAHQACMVSGSATREGRRQYRQITEQRSTEKLGDGKAGI